MFNIIVEAKKIQGEIIEWRRYIHKNAESGIDLTNTVNFVCDKLNEFGIEYVRFGNYGVLGTIKGSQNGKTFALRADMDALNAYEEANVEFKSINSGKAHLCGHDTHTAMLLGAAKILDFHREYIKGTIKFIFQPDEESGKGAVKLIKEHNILEGIDSIFGIHIGTSLPSGYVVYTIGSALAASGTFKIEIKGKGAHGAMPHASVDPVVTAAEFITSLQTIVSRNVDPTDSAVVTIGKILGGTSHNTIPNKVEVSGTFRAVTNETTQLLINKINQILDGICKAHGADYEIDIDIATPALVNPKELTELAVVAASKIVGEKIICFQKPQMVGEDFAYYMQQIPGCFINLGAGTAEEGYPYPLHNPEVRFNEDVFWIGSAIHVQMALDWLNAN